MAIPNFDFLTYRWALAELSARTRHPRHDLERRRWPAAAVQLLNAHPPGPRGCWGCSGRWPCLPVVTVITRLRQRADFVGGSTHTGQVSSEPIPLFPVHRVDPPRFAAAQHRLFAGMNLRIGHASTVHGVLWTQWINGLTLPVPACHQGWSGFGAGGDLLPTLDAVTCRKCLRLDGHVADPAQPALFALPSVP